jgi:hypothetical protein
MTTGETLVGIPWCDAFLNSNEISESQCAEVLDEIVGKYPSSIPTKTYGDSKVDSCIVYGFDVFWDYEIHAERRRVDMERD